MATFEAVIEGLQVIASYCSKGVQTDSFEANHDIVYAGMIEVDREQMSQNDLRKMEELGWHWNDEFGCWARFV